ncbi:MAG: phosphate ABC transporter ATP-binding protein PstB [Bacillota bacterium]|nr:phosphate ABC transporter ATP-binding protein PstB [Bacillota bacterium]
MSGVIETVNLNLYYGTYQALKGVNVGFADRRVTSVIGPSGCGKSTLLRTLNRMNDHLGARVTGQVLFRGEDIYMPATDLVALRSLIGMVFQRPNPFPFSVFDNVAMGPRMHSVPASQIPAIVEESLVASDLWHRVKDRLLSPALELSLGQQQQLCIARVIATNPEVILFDEPCSALDPETTLHIEELMRRLSKEYSVIVVTHNMQQAARVSETTVFMLSGQIIEVGPTLMMFTSPSDKRTEDYISGRYG